MNPHNPDFVFPISRRIKLRAEATTRQLFCRSVIITGILGCLYLWWLP